jgi:hypothetical protein
MLLGCVKGLTLKTRETDWRGDESAMRAGRDGFEGKGSCNIEGERLPMPFTCYSDVSSMFRMCNWRRDG